MNLGLQGKVALITGASQGIGRATAIRLAGEGVKVMLVARRPELVEEVKAEIGAAGGVAAMLPGDVTKPEAREAMIVQTLATFGQLDILVHCAGIMENGGIENTSTELWRRTMDINVDAVFELTRLAVPHLVATRGNVIIM